MILGDKVKLSEYATPPDPTTFKNCVGNMIFIDENDEVTTYPD